MKDTNILIKQFPDIKPEDITPDTLRSLSANSLPMWCLANGVKVDGHPIDFENHRYLLPLYMDNTNHIALLKAAQIGASIWMLLRTLWFLEQNQGRKAIIYMPTMESAANLSADRLEPIINSCPSVRDLYDAGSKQSLRKIGESSLYVSYLGGTASKDSIPADMLCFDEVRLVEPKDIDQALERIAHSTFKHKIFASTCGREGTTIEARYQRGKQYVWHAKCKCGGVDLARTFPDCVVDDKTRGKLYLRCPKCKSVINDPQNGRYIAMNPTADFNSYHTSQLNSKYISLKEIWDMYKNTTNISEFHQAKLGLSYTDETSRVVTMDQLNACVNPDIKWPGGSKTRCAMGVDVGANYLAVVIGDIHPDGNKKRIRHVEFIERYNPRYYDVHGKPQSPWVRLHELMKAFNVQLAVVDAMPEATASLQFAQTYPGRVFLAFFQQSQRDVVVWGDRVRAREGVRKAGPMFKFKYHVMLNRYSSILAMLTDWASGSVEIPDPQHLIQECRDESTGILQPEAIGLRLFKHLASQIKVFKETNGDTGEGVWSFTYVGGQDPHLGFANCYMNVALERLRRQVTFVFA